MSRRWILQMAHDGTLDTGLPCLDNSVDNAMREDHVAMFAQAWSQR